MVQEPTGFLGAAPYTCLGRWVLLLPILLILTLMEYCCMISPLPLVLHLNSVYLLQME